MRTVYATHPDFVKHYLPHRSHPERPERIEAIWRTLDQQQLTQRMHSVQVAAAEDPSIAQVHDSAHLDLLRWVEKQSQPVLIDRDTYALPQSYQIAKLAAGAGIACLNAIATGAARNGLAVVRPPGHHATPSSPMGFCLLNNIAISTRYAQQVHGFERVLIVDYDVHHGNGTQDIFYDDDSVLFFSTHQSPLYPGTGHKHEIGRGRGRYQTINVPLPPYCGDRAYAAVYEALLWPAAQRFQPQLILVSAGFDAHWMDPLAQMSLSLRGYDHLTRELIRIADELCEGRIVFLLEGGYDLDVIRYGVANTARALLGDPETEDFLGPADHPEPEILSIIAEIQRIHTH